MIAKVFSAIPYGYDGCIVDVEASSARSLPSFNIVGMANKTISEARERVRSAITNSNFQFPDKKVTINLAPAEIPKDGSHLDLPIALAVLILSRHVLPSDLEKRLFVGELSLDGLTKPVRGIISVVEAAQKAGFKEVYVPKANLEQAKLVPDIQIIGVANLQELLLHLKGIHSIQNISTTKASTNAKQAAKDDALTTSILVKNTVTPFPTLDDVCGQDFVKRAITIAIAGRHNILLSGPPGVGKTLLARVAAGLLPLPTPSEQISITKIHSLCSTSDEVILTRPFRAPHHTASTASIIGGGNKITPGEITLAHHGILFLDELPEYSRTVLEALRQPLEDHVITVTRARQRVTYPANFMLIATMNPCPCGYLNDPDKECSCTPLQISHYHKRISGPILDRIDMVINVGRVKQEQLLSTSDLVKNTQIDTDISPRRNLFQKHSNTVKALSTPKQNAAIKQIEEAILCQQKRYSSHGVYNSNLSSLKISNYVKITPTGVKLLQEAVSSLNLSARAYFKTIKVAQTIADLSSLTEVGAEQISEALSFRQTI